MGKFFRQPSQTISPPKVIIVERPSQQDVTKNAIKQESLDLRNRYRHQKEHVKRRLGRSSTIKTSNSGFKEPNKITYKTLLGE